MLQDQRVEALERLFELKDGSPRLFRHDIYGYIANHAPATWALGFTDPKGVSDRAKALTAPAGGSRPNVNIVKAWALAMKEALGGFEFDKPVRGKQSGDKPLGHWTIKLATIG